MIQRYIADIQPINIDAIGASITGKTELIEDKDTLKIKIKATGTPTGSLSIILDNT